MTGARHRAKGLLLHLLALLSALSHVVAPSPAQAGDGAGIHFTAQVTLPHFPCPITMSCRGSFVGRLAGTMAGDDSAPWSATFAEADLTVEFEYEDANCTDGRSDGTVEVTAGLGEVFGTYDAGPLPRTVVGLVAQGTFSSVRQGPVTRITVADMSVRLDVLDVGTREVATGGQGAIAAAFIPLIEELPECQTIPPDPPPLTALVEGVGALWDLS